MTHSANAGASLAQKLACYPGPRRLARYQPQVDDHYLCWNLLLESAPDAQTPTRGPRS